jgi:hypothetical protein
LYRPQPDGVALIVRSLEAKGYSDPQRLGSGSHLRVVGMLGRQTESEVISQVIRRCARTAVVAVEQLVQHVDVTSVVEVPMRSVWLVR